MRVVGGKYRSRVLAGFDGNDVRPTADRTKEALFNILALKIRGARVLDLFAGSGSLGIECLSRGAKSVLFNDVSKDSVALIQKNLSALKVPADEYTVRYSDYSTCLACQKDGFDLIFIDPPYRLEIGVDAVKTIAKKGLLNDGGTLVFERDVPFDGDVDGLEKYDERKYGKAFLTFFRKA